MADLKTDFLNDILSESMDGKRKYKITHEDGTTEEVTIEDISEYEQVGSEFGAAQINETNRAVNECFQSVSDGKSLLASAITDQKVPTDADAEFTEMEANIRAIKRGSGNAVTSDVKLGKTFTNDDGIEYVGTYDFAAETQGTATAADITAGKKAWVNGVLVTGTRPAPLNQLSGTISNVKRSQGTASATFSSAFDKVPTINFTEDINYADVSVSSVTRTGVTFKITKQDGTSFDWVGNIYWTASAS